VIDDFVIGYRGTGNDPNAFTVWSTPLLTINHTTGNATFAGTISSGAITSSGLTVSGAGSISGNLLVGASSAPAKLTVGTFGDTARAAQFHGGSILVDGGAASEILIGDGNVAYMSIQTTDNATAMNIRNYTGNANLVTFERVSGRVGIGVPSITQKFAVGGDAHTRVQVDGSSTAGVYFTIAGANGATIRSGATNNLQFYTTDIAATIDSSKNFNINAGALQLGGTPVIDSSRNLTSIVTATVGQVIVNGGVRTNRASTNGSIFFAGGTVDANHALWNGYNGDSPTTRGAVNTGFDGMWWNTYRGLRIRGGSGGAYNCLLIENTSSNTNTHTVKLYASNVLRLSTTTSGVTVAGSLTGMTTANFSGKVDFQGDAAIEGGTGYGVFKGYGINNNHMIISRGILSGTTSSPTITGGHHCTFVEYCNTDSEGFYFKRSDISSYPEIARITRIGITSSGNITAYSDERLKSNIKTLDGSKVLQMRGVSFIKEGREGSGVIAQELELIAPELVHTADDEMGTKSVAYGNLVGYLIENSKQQQAEIDELKALVKTLMEK